MATISSIWSFSPELPLMACGIDSETIERFSNCPAPLEHYMPFVFTKNEYFHAFTLQKPQAALCASFCSKEAFRKALGEPCNYTDIEIVWNPENERHRLILNEELKERHGIGDAQAIIRANPLDENQLVALVCLFEGKI